MEADDPNLGTIVDGRYRLSSVLGKGGMGVVYRAEQLSVARPVAVKVIHPSREVTAEAAERFRREARVLAAIQHPHIVSLIDFGQREGGDLYLVMELLDGKPLSEVLAREGPFGEARARALMRQLASSLQEAHAHHVVHRDLKPSNILMLRYGGHDDFVKLIDFGIAKDVSGADVELTGGNDLIGSPRYLSPEQATGQPVSPSSDLYALGMVMYEVITGTCPYGGKGTASDYALYHVVKEPAPPEVAGRRLTGPLIDLVLTCLAKDPALRPANASEILEFLRITEGDPGGSEATPSPALAATATHDRATPAPVPPAPRSLRRLALAATAGATLLALGGVLWFREPDRGVPRPTGGGAATAGPVVASDAAQAPLGAAELDATGAAPVAAGDGRAEVDGEAGAVTGAVAVAEADAAPVALAEPGRPARTPVRRPPRPTLVR